MGTGQTSSITAVPLTSEPRQTRSCSLNDYVTFVLKLKPFNIRHIFLKKLLLPPPSASFTSSSMASSMASSNSSNLENGDQRRHKCHFHHGRVGCRMCKWRRHVRRRSRDLTPSRPITRTAFREVLTCSLWISWSLLTSDPSSCFSSLLSSL